VDDLQEVITENIATRKQAAIEAEKIVNDRSNQFMHWFNNLHSIPTIRQLRDQTSQLAQIELQNAQKRLQAGEDPDAVLQQFAHALSQKFMHAPTESLKQNKDEELLIATRELFDLDKSSKTKIDT
jgi:glutamyl-tRNA reductase